jgi:hypothetical protein
MVLKEVRYGIEGVYLLAEFSCKEGGIGQHRIGNCGWTSLILSRTGPMASCCEFFKETFPKMRGSY